MIERAIGHAVAGEKRPEGRNAPLNRNETREVFALLVVVFALISFLLAIVLFSISSSSDKSVTASQLGMVQHAVMYVAV